MTDFSFLCSSDLFRFHVNMWCDQPSSCRWNRNYPLWKRKRCDRIRLSSSCEQGLSFIWPLPRWQELFPQDARKKLLYKTALYTLSQLENITLFFGPTMFQTFGVCCAKKTQLPLLHRSLRNGPCTRYKAWNFQRKFACTTTHKQYRFTMILKILTHSAYRHPCVTSYVSVFMARY